MSWTETGIWSEELALTGHLHAPRLAEFISTYFPKDKLLIDVGCGDAYYLDFLQKKGFNNLLGLEGRRLPNFIFNGQIIVQDLAQRKDIGVRGNLTCLEVGEHVPAKYEQVVLDNLTEWCDDLMILSWAIPWIDDVQGGQGTGHFNERENDYIIEQLANRGFDHLTEDTKRVRSLFGKGLIRLPNVDNDNNCWYFRNTLMCFKRKK